MVELRRCYEELKHRCSNEYSAVSLDIDELSRLADEISKIY
jgi:hypothetical protein